MLPRPRTGLDFSKLQASFWTPFGVRYRLLAIGAAVLLVAGCDQQTSAPAQQTPAENVPHGLIDLVDKERSITPRAKAVAAMAELARQGGHQFHTLTHNDAPAAALIQLDLNRHTPQIIADTKGVKPIEAIAESRMSVIVGSSFVSQVHQMQPIGVLQVGGKLLQSVEQHGYTRILGIRGPDDTHQATASSGHRFEVVHRSQWPTARMHSALQAGPGIIEKGALDISERDLQRPKYFRSFVAECGESSVVGATLVPMHLYSLGAELVAYFDRHNLDCTEVVNLAGDREALLLVREGDSVAYLGDPQPAKAGLIGFASVETAP